MWLNLATPQSGKTRLSWRRQLLSGDCGLHKKSPLSYPGGVELVLAAGAAVQPENSHFCCCGFKVSQGKGQRGRCYTPAALVVSGASASCQGRIVLHGKTLPGVSRRGLRNVSFGVCNQLSHQSEKDFRCLEILKENKNCPHGGEGSTSDRRGEMGKGWDEACFDVMTLGCSMCTRW